MTTRNEQRFYDDVTAIRRALERIADALERRPMAEPAGAMATSELRERNNPDA